jgi:hypothetical protein
MSLYLLGVNVGHSLTGSLSSVTGFVLIRFAMIISWVADARQGIDPASRYR